MWFDVWSMTLHALSILTVIECAVQYIDCVSMSIHPFIPIMHIVHTVPLLPHYQAPLTVRV